MDQGWSTPIDAYCERISAAFWAEPVNAVTNAAFIIAALAAFARWRRTGHRDASTLILTVLTALIGCGSFLFHTVATRWAALADVVPIALFILGYLALALWRFVGFGGLGTGVGLFLFVGLSAALPRMVQLPPGPWQSSLGYLPALIALVVIGVVVRWQAHAATATALLAAAALFAVSLTLRSIDQAVCLALPLGTHFLWHVLNAVVLYHLLAAAIRHGPRSAG